MEIARLHGLPLLFRSAKGAVERTANNPGTLRAAPVLRVFFKSAKGAAERTANNPGTLRAAPVLRVFFKTHAPILAAAAIGFAQPDTARFRANARLVLAPVQVTDAAGRNVEGLTEADFELYDRGVQRKFKLEPENAPLSVVVAIQSSVVAGPALAKIQKIGSLMQPLVAGERGQVAVMTYSDQIRIRQEFTSDAAGITQTFRAIEPDGEGGMLHDAVIQAVAMLAQRPAGRRRVLIVIGEGKDRSSRAKLEAAVSKAQEANVTVYPVSFSAYATAFTSRGSEQFASGKRVYQAAGGMNLLEIFREIGRSAAQNSHEALANYTGGMRVSFVKLAGLETVIQKVGADLHSQYLLSFQPVASGGDGGDSGYRELRVRVRGAGVGWRIRHRPGYWQTTNE